MKTVLAPIDLSEAAAGVISQAGALAGDVAGRVLLLHVVPPPAVINEYAPEAERLAEEEKKKAETGLEHWRQRLEGTGVDAEIAVLHGAPVATILGEAARANADYIVMGSHGHGALYHFFVGGTAGGVIQKSPCPVVVVPSQKAQPHPSASRPKPT
jgi:nucleotide-binding universal stress UspA family protein